VEYNANQESSVVVTSEPVDLSSIAETVLTILHTQSIVGDFFAEAHGAENTHARDQDVSRRR
jgi:hypothetical protein